MAGPRRAPLLISEALALGLIAVVLLAFGVGTLAAHSTMVGAALAGGDAGRAAGPPNYVRNVLELASFAAGVFVSLVALIALLATRGQLLEAENARRAQVLLEIQRQWSDAHLKTSRDFCREQQPIIAGMTEEQRIAHIKSNTPTSSTVAVMVFCEYVGFFVARGYIDFEDVYELFAPALNVIYDVFFAYFQDRAKTERNPDLYSNARTLLQRVRDKRDKR